MATRGRRQSETTIKRRAEQARIEEMFKNPPSWLQGEAYPDLLTQQLMQSDGDSVEKELIADYGNNYPHDLIFELNDLNVSPKALDRYEAHKSTLEAGRLRDTSDNKRNSESKGRQLCELHQALIKQIKPTGKPAVRGVATQIHRQLAAQGSGGKTPCIKTIERYIRKFTTANSIKVGQAIPV